MNYDLDKKLIALCIQNPELLGQSLKDLKSEHIRGSYAKIYQLLKSYYTKHKKLPSLDLFEEQLQKNKKKIFGNDTNADDLILGIRTEAVLASADDYSFVVEELRERASHGILKEAIPQAVEAIQKGQDIQLATEILQSAVSQIRSSLTQTPVAVTNSHEYADEIKQRYEDTVANPNQAWGIRTGFTKLDQATYGMKAGELFIVSARHGNGKSIWLLSVAVNAFRAGHNIVLVSLEMPTEQMWLRFMACYANLPINAITAGTLTPEQQVKLFTAIEELKAYANRFTILDAPHITVDTIASELTSIAQTYKPDLLAIDYLGIVKATDSRLKDNEAQASVVEDVRKLARVLKIPIISAVQLNREPGKAKKTKDTSRLSRSDTIGSTSDVVLQIEEVDAEEAITRLSNRTKIYCIKNRKGPAPFEMEVCKNFACSRFEDWDTAGWKQ